MLTRLGDPVIVLDTEARFRWANEAAERLFGWSAAGWVGVSALDFVHPDDLEMVVLSFGTVQSKQAGTAIEVRVLTQEGWRLVEVVGAPIGAPDPEFVAFCLRDLTQRRRFEVASNSDAKFRSLVHNAATLTMFVSSDGVLEAASGAVTRQLGWDPEVIEGTPFAGLIDGPVPVFRGRPQPVTIEVRLRRGDGLEPVPFELSVVDLVDDPTVGGFVVTGHDIRARKEAEEEVRQTLSLLTATLEATADGIVVVDRGGRMTSFNQQFVDLWGLPDDIVAGRDNTTALSYVLDQLESPGVFLAKVQELFVQPEAESLDTLLFIDGRVVERYSRPQRVGGVVIGRVWSFRDVTAQKALQRQLADQASRDSLTGLANQAVFRDRVQQAIGRSAGAVSVLIVDLDNFKSVNDSLGHPAGDQLIVSTGHLIERCLRPGDLAARLGGDEFGILLEGLHHHEEAVTVAERVLSVLATPVSIESREMVIAASIGVAHTERDAGCDEVLRNADLAMYTAKMRGRGRVEVYEPVMHQRAIDRFDIETSLRRAIEAGQLVLAYQPIADLTTGEVVALEALIRWNHPVRGLLLPDAFIPVAEETGLIPLVGAFVLREACRQVRIWQGAYAAAARLSVGVNVSALEITRPDFAVEAGKAIASSGLRSSSLVIEITENALASDTAAAARNLDELKQLGCQIAVDDFGTGYASLAYLQQYPVDILKLDRCFVEGIDGLPKQAALPEAIIRLAQHLGLGLIAEGVERQTQRDRLVEAGCGLAQGYLLGRPMDAAAFGALLAAGGRVATLPASAAIG